MSFGAMEILVILVLVLIVFGAGKLPKVMGDLGKGVKSFKDGISSEGSSADQSQHTNDDKRK